MSFVHIAVEAVLKLLKQHDYRNVAHLTPMMINAATRSVCLTLSARNDERRNMKLYANAMAAR